MFLIYYGILEKVWNKSNEYWIPKKHSFSGVTNVFNTWKTHKWFHNGLKMTYLWDILKIKLYYDSIIQHLYESKGLFQDFAKLTNGISLGYSGNILE